MQKLIACLVVIFFHSSSLTSSEILPIRHKKKHKSRQQNTPPSKSANSKHFRITGTSKEIFTILSFVLPDDPIIVEAGAFDGNDTKTMALLYPRGKIYSFEPVPELYQRLCSTTRTLENVKTQEKALSDQTGRAIFHLSNLNGDSDHVSQSSSLLKPKEHLQEFPWVNFQRSIEVETITLDDWARKEGIDHVDFLWLDMQGWELNTLKASQISKAARAIWIEVELKELYEGQYLLKDVQEWMDANHFGLACTDFDVNDSSVPHGNALYIRD